MNNLVMSALAYLYPDDSAACFAIATGLRSIAGGELFHDVFDVNLDESPRR